MLLKVSLLSFEGGDLVLQFAVFILLVKVRLLHVLFGLENIVCQVLSDFLSLSCKSIIQSFFFRSQILDLLFVEMELLLESCDCLFQAVYLALQGGCESAGSHGVVCLAH